MKKLQKFKTGDRVYVTRCQGFNRFHFRCGLGTVVGSYEDWCGGRACDEGDPMYCIDFDDSGRSSWYPERFIQEWEIDQPSIVVKKQDPWKDVDNKKHLWSHPQYGECTYWKLTPNSRTMPPCYTDSTNTVLKWRDKGAVVVPLYKTVED